MSADRNRSRRLAALAPLLALALLVPAGAVHAQDASPVPSAAPEERSYLFVMSAPSGAVDAETITLRGAPSLIWLTDRPYRDGGQLLPAQLATAWEGLVAGFDGVAPNAVLSVLGEDAVTNTVIALTGVEAVTPDDTGATADIVLRYTVVDGELPPGEIGTASLFIDDVIPTAGIKACLMASWVV